MLDWKTVEDALKKYYQTNDEAILELMIKKLDPYIKTCAHNFVFKARSNGVFIPFEDFYSNLMLAIWQGIEDFRNIRTSTFKNVALRRIFIAEKKTWNQYKKTGNKKFDKNGVTYGVTRWEELETLNNNTQYTIYDNAEVFIEEKLLIENFKKLDPFKGTFIELLSLGYSPKEICLLLGISQTYDAKTRKKCQRIKESFLKYIS
ncbi:BacL2 family protein [Enterococcus villorum]|uniref:Uncharacterized protein n=3 Tax=Enterococcus villorum TaxID=112904 RepID=A0A511J1J6_9ENTE|nr:BacL2 family protein [Enterococcus villorum]EOH91588.1 hypothetical protein UAO_00921 [Enterococcus villorum ATCC 700913]EOW76966.1 hypothetical protein I591_02274 [Enterococcus villorum ATCC 700913]GEL91890.1 hypothetical protein EVI01_12270 [Enterococcus villorum]